METASIYTESEEEALRYKWIESEKVGQDLGESAIRAWVSRHWWGFLRVRWLEHIQGKRFWVELDRGDFGLLQRRFKDNALLLDRILDRLIAGQENLDVLCWAIDFGIPMEPVLEMLEAFDINGRRLAHRFDFDSWSPSGQAGEKGHIPVVKIDPTWLAWEGSLIPRLARSIAADGAFDRLPILGDALEEAGCTDPAILDHCRAATADIRWSWLVDLILWGK
jgi:hypothetical protein